jgi:predicted DNA-binding protein (UPF0251 family)
LNQSGIDNKYVIDLYIMGMRLNLREIEAFALVGRHLSFSRAAAGLGLSQPRLSAMVKAFEKRLGVAVFVRNSRNVSLTPAWRRTNVPCEQGACPIWTSWAAAQVR